MAVSLTVITVLCFCLINKAVPLYADTEHPVRILCYGDSNTYGYDPDPYTDRYPESVRWTGILQEKLGDEYLIIEEGKNGRTTGYRPDADVSFTEDGPQDLLYRFEMHQPVDMLVIMLGSNDCVPKYGLTSEDVATGMDALITAVEEWASQNRSEPPAFLIVAPPVLDEEILNTPLGTPETAEFIQKLNELGGLYQQIAQNHGCDFANARDIELSDLDHIHLTEEGHVQLADLLLETIKYR